MEGAQAQGEPAALDKEKRRREVKTAKRVARAALAFAFGVLAAPLLPFLLAWFAGKDAE